VSQTGKSIILIGMMGAGKSVVGSCLQRRTKLTLLDTDEIVASKFGMSINEIFSKYGEQAFRETETQALHEITPAKQMIIVTGGGIILREENIAFLKRLGAVIWLDANEETLFKRDPRIGRCCEASIQERRSRECYRRGCRFMPKLHVFASIRRC